MDEKDIQPNELFALNLIRLLCFHSREDRRLHISLSKQINKTDILQNFSKYA